MSVMLLMLLLELKVTHEQLSCETQKFVCCLDLEPARFELSIGAALVYVSTVWLNLQQLQRHRPLAS